MPKGRPRIEIFLNQKDRMELEMMLRKRSLDQSLAVRAKIVLLCGQHLTDVRIAEQLGTTNATVGKWRKRFIT